MNRCPSELALESYLLDPRDAAVHGHVEACARCRDRVAEMRREGEEFTRSVYPRTVEAVEEAVRADRNPWRKLVAWLVPVGGLAAAAAAALLLSPRPPSDYLGAKGTPMSLQAWVGGESGAREVADGASVPAGGALRFRVVTSSPCRLWIVSVDGTGSVSRLFPAQGEPAPVAPGSGTLPGGVVLDGTAGPERLYALCSAQPVPLAEVESAARAAATGGADAVRRAQALSGLPKGTLQATLLLEKVP